MGRIERLTVGRFASTIKLKTGETSLLEVPANYSVNVAIGGTLLLSNLALRFIPNVVDNKLGASELVIDRSDIQRLHVTPIDLKSFFSGGLRRRLAVTTSHQEYLFVVSKPQDIADRLEKLLGLPAKQ